MVERRLYLINNRLRFLRFPINSGRSTSSLWVKSNVVNWAQFPKTKQKFYFNEINQSKANRFHLVNVQDDYVQHQVLIIVRDDQLLSVMNEYDFHVNSTFVNSRK